MQLEDMKTWLFSELVEKFVTIEICICIKKFDFRGFLSLQ